MAKSARLTRDMRSAILVKALAFRFGAEEAALEKRWRELGNQLYDTLWADTEKLAKAMPSEWLCWGDHLAIRSDGYDYNYKAVTADTRPWKANGCLDRDLPLGRDRPMPVNNGVRAEELNIEKGRPGWDLVNGLHKDFTKYADRREQLREKIVALLASCNTVDQLLKAWPESEPFIPKSLNYSTALVPVGLSNEVNKLLGLSPVTAVGKVIQKAQG